jgi:hypothetical protein
MAQALRVPAARLLDAPESKAKAAKARRTQV